MSAKMVVAVRVLKQRHVRSPTSEDRTVVAAAGGAFGSSCLTRGPSAMVASPLQYQQEYGCMQPALSPTLPYV
eukprot:3107249-Pleurochrysis_carterae.AAC.1